MGEGLVAERRFLGHFRKTLIMGLLVLVPIVITYTVLRLALDFVDGFLQPVAGALLGRRIPGLGILLLAILVYVIGLLGSHFLGRQAIRLFQSGLLRVPVVGFVYSASKQLVESFSGSEKTGFNRVVAIEYPRPGVWAIGFLTGVTHDESGKKMGIVYIPTAPTPNSGWVAILPVEQIFDTDLSVQLAMQVVLSGGIIAPYQIKKEALVL